MSPLHGEPENGTTLTAPRCSWKKQENSMKKLLVIGLVLALSLGPSLAFAQTSLRPERPEEQILVGEVQSVDDSGTEITLTDGAKLLTPPGKMLRPGVLEEGNGCGRGLPGAREWGQDLDSTRVGQPGGTVWWLATAE
jgi:hypothetical protein